MGLFAAVRVAFGALLLHKGRSVLTSLGIVIGIGSVIAMVSAGDGVQRKLDERMASVGRNLVASVLRSVSPFFLMSKVRETRLARKAIATFDVRPPRRHHRIV